MGILGSVELENELRKIADYIVALRREIAVLQANEIHMKKIPAAGQELAAVVSSTEGATNEIMAIAENVMSAEASDLSDYKAFVDKEMMAIFETCAFQDLTGQRISRVVKTLEHIEARVSRFATYTGVQDEAGHANEAEAEAAARREKLLLHGPSIADEGNTQPDIDRLLAAIKGL
ncbi:MAG: protein phosphatase CheZ [Xanthobacteraceae bacterium]|nr:protein phosphatase CheZ [Xanthobacteraceae bacterium]